MHPYTLVCAVSLTDPEHTWRNAVRQVWGVQKGAIKVEDMRDIVHNLGVPYSKISPTLHTGVLLMPNQALMRLINLSNGNTADVKVSTLCRGKSKHLRPLSLTEPCKMSRILTACSVCIRVFISQMRFLRSGAKSIFSNAKAQHVSSELDASM